MLSRLHDAATTHHEHAPLDLAPKLAGGDTARLRELLPDRIVAADPELAADELAALPSRD